MSAASDSFTSAADYGAALKHIQAAVDIQPDDPDLLQQLGYVRYLAGDDTGALAIYDDLIERGHDSWAVLANKALVQVSRNDYRGAIESFERAIARGGESAELVNNLGVAWHREGSVEQACSCFAKALEIDPNYAEAETNLREVQQARRRT